MIERMFVDVGVNDDTVLEVAAHPAAIISALAVHDRRQAAITTAVGEFDRDQSWALDGARSMKAWLIAFTGRSPGDAGDCDLPAWQCHAHHIHTWLDGGRTDLDNLVLLCSFHHHLIHHHGCDTKLLPDNTFTITLPNHTTLTSRAPP